MWKLDLVELQCYVATDTCIKSSAIWEWCILNYTVSNMSLNIVHLLGNSQAFDMKELLNFSIDSALELHSSLSNSLTLENTQSGVELTACQQQLSEVIQFLQELIRVNPECITPSNLLRFLENVCYTAIHVHQSYLRGQRSGSDDMLQSVYKLFAAILLTPCESGFQELKFRIQQECLEGLRHYIEEQRLLVTLPSEENEKGIQSSVLSMRDISGILDYTFNTAEAWNTDQQHTHVHVHRDDSWLEDCFKYLVDVLEFSEATTCSHVSGILLPKLLNLSQDKLDTNLSIIWDRLLNIHKTSAKVRAGHTCNVYITLCGLSELYIPLVLSSTPDHSSVQHSFTLHVEEAFWRVIQAGLVHTDSLTRKQACFLMKRAIESASANNLKIPDCASPSPVKITHQEQLTEPWSSSLEGAYLFWWSCESQKKLLAMWADFFLMYETLDEVQVHVVTPVMLKMSSLIQAASTPHLDGRPLLHSSWLTVLFSRWFVHETKTISQWGLVEYLGLNITSCPILQEGGTEFFFSSVLPVLNDSSLYVNKTQGDHSRPLVAEAFTQFMQTCVKILTAQQCADFLRELVAAVCRQSWTPVSLTFVVDALTNLPECSAWGPTELQLLREMQFSCVNMLSVSYRRVVQCLMLQAVLRLLDKDRTSLQQLSVLLTVFSKCLCRGSPLWTQVCEWITASRDTQLFGSNGDMVAAVCSEVTTLLTFDPSALSNASIDLSDIGEPSRVACLVLLVVDAKHISRERSSRTNNGSHLHAILAPLVSVLASIGSHIYLPVIKADTALQLLHSILLHLHHPSTSGGSPDTDQVQHEMFTLLFPCLEEIFSFITRRLQSSDIAESADTSRVSLYLSVLESIHTFLERSSVSALMGNVLISGQARLIECCKLLVIQSTEGRESNVLQSHFQSYAACCLLLWLVQMTKSKTLLTLPWDTLLPLVTFGDDIPTPMVIIPDAGATNNLRKMSNLILYTKWKCMSVLLQATLPSPITQPYEAILAACVRDLTLLKGTDAVPLMKSAKVLIYKISQDARSMCVELVEAAWSVILDEWRQKAQKFWLIYAAGVELIFQQCFLVAEEGTEMHDALDKVISSILTLGEGKHKILLIFVKHLCSHWASQFDGKESRILTMKAITNHMSLLVELCTVSSRFSKDIRQQQDTSVFLSQQSHLQTVKDDLIACAEQRPRQRRVVLLNFLLKIATRQSLECCRLITVFLQGLLKKFHELKTSTKPRDMMNSQLHRQNIGLWQMLLVLVPYILKDCAGQILEDVLSSVIREKQSSLKYLMIWVATRLLILVPSLEEHIWNLIQSPRDTSEIMSAH
ncbi:probable methyltransferase TARBP1 isoform X2 [Acanthaster planci]|uniref:Probable methyltransferase TARBP1 isoform X2 n=1 Tax=Acanthaster planci TaxID=133434 RepID=A0A8B7Y606_ACAPL|nr:probable methyltransferase TARBP1 isoform X2 [Acanthaster planci]